VTANNIRSNDPLDCRAGSARQVHFTPHGNCDRQALGGVLLIGAGTGLLMWRSRWPWGQASTVEIDPALPVGRHPDTSTRTWGAVHIADGHQFLQNTPQHYDLIMFTLPDSLTAGRAVRDPAELPAHRGFARGSTWQRLAPGGTFAMYNWYARSC
jgi:hypothetical protein